MVWDLRRRQKAIEPSNGRGDEARRKQGDEFDLNRDKERIEIKIQPISSPKLRAGGRMFGIKERE